MYIYEIYSLKGGQPVYITSCFSLDDAKHYVFLLTQKDHGTYWIEEYFD